MRPREIVGVVGAVRATALEAEAEPHMYVAYYQTPQSYATLLVRTSTEPLSLAGAVRDAVRAADPRLPVYALATMEELIAETIEARRFNMLMLGLFAALALLLSAVGLYGVISYSVSERRQEIGVRLALGARRGDILRLVLKEGLLLVVGGIVIGLAGALALTGLLRNLLFGISPYDPLTMGAISLLIAGVALVSCYLPARRAMGVDPGVALIASHSSGSNEVDSPSNSIDRADRTAAFACRLARGVGSGAALSRRVALGVGPARLQKQARFVMA